MKRIAALAALLFSALLPCAAQSASNVAGTWAVAYDVAGRSIKITCDVTQADGKLAGTCTGDEKMDYALTGEVKGQAVTFTFSKAYGGTPITDTFTSTGGMIAGVMKGTILVAPLNINGTFTATMQ